MKIVHISDIHWRGLSRHDEYTDSFERLFEKIKEIGPDIIVNTGDTFHTKTQAISPEIIERLAWMIRELADIAPTYHILGNHDGVIKNDSREDTISPIHNAVAHKNSYLMKDSGNYPIHGFEDYILNVFSPFDHENWNKVQPEEGKINIALYHGAVSKARLDNGMILEDGEEDLSFFAGYDYALLGDIHQQQYLSYRADKFGKAKAWIGYPGSLIQQNYGESVQKGFYVWDIREKDDWDVDFHILENKHPYITTKWNGRIDGVLNAFRNFTKGELSGVRYRIQHDVDIPEADKREIKDRLFKEDSADDVQFAKIKSQAGNVLSDDIVLDTAKTLSRKSLRNDSAAIYDLYKEFVRNSNLQVSTAQQEEAREYINRYIERLNLELGDTSKFTHWNLKWIEFDNIFGYGEGNRVDFDKKDGKLVGVFGKNYIGKSSLIGAITYALFNATDRGPVSGTAIINDNKNECFAKVCFEADNKTYVIERKSERIFKGDDDTGRVKNYLDFYEVKSDGEKLSLVGVSTTETDKTIRSIIGSAEDFFLTSLAAQGDLFRFINEGSTDRKKHLTRFLELDIFDKLHEYAKEDSKSINLSKNILSDTEWEKKISRVEKEISVAEKKVETNRRKKERLDKKKDKLRDWVEKYKQNASQQNAQKYKAVVDAIHKNKSELTTKQNNIKNLKDSIRNHKKDVSSLEESLSGIDRNSLVAKVDSLRSFQNTVNEIHGSLRVETGTLEQQKKSIALLETVPCGDEFPTCKFIKNSHEDKSKIEAQEKLVEKLKANYDEISSELNELLMGKFEESLKNYDNMKEQFDRKNNTLIKYESQLEVLEVETKTLRSEIDKLEEEAKVLAAHLDSKLEQEYEQKVLEGNEIRAESKKIEDEYSDLLQFIGSKKRELASLNDERESTKNATHRYNIVTSISSAFHKNGIPAIILRTQLPAINEEINKILSTVGNMKLTIEADDKKMDVYLENHNNGGRKRIIETCSGAEKTLSSFVIRCALNNISHVSKSDVFIIDEGFGALDDDNLPKSLELIRIFKEYFKVVLVISHIDEVKEIVDELIEIDRIEDMGSFYAKVSA